MKWWERTGWTCLVILLLTKCCQNQQIDNYLYCRAICESQGELIEVVAYDEAGMICECTTECPGGREV